jgi:C-terminal processing protease CtpA/Prc
VDKKLAPAEKLKELRNELRTKSEHSIMPGKAKDKLVLGLDGAVKVKWLRNEKPFETSIVKAQSHVVPVAKANGALHVRLMPGIGQALKSAIGGNSITLDLRNNAFADITSVNEALSALAPSGTYGVIANQRGGSAKLVVKNGREGKLQCKVIVDKSTHGGAALLAEALKANGLATVEGSTAGDQIAVEVVKLPDGSGFTLAKGWFKQGASK